ncbi:MAG: TlpA disulfide reductase family protein [Tibeticola sp.]
MFNELKAKRLRTRIGHFLGAPLLAIALLPTPSFAVQIGDRAAAVEAVTSDGKSVQLADFKGKLLYLDFWASWCGPCKQTFPWMNQMQNKYGPRGLQILAINLDKKSEDARAFLAENRANFMVAFDPAGTTPKTYAIKGMPTSVLIDADGKVIAVHTGFKAEQSQELERLITNALQSAEGASK